MTSVFWAELNGYPVETSIVDTAKEKKEERID
jgi:hypothetical protein